MRVNVFWKVRLFEGEREWVLEGEVVEGEREWVFGGKIV